MLQSQFIFVYFAENQSLNNWVLTVCPGCCHPGPHKICFISWLASILLYLQSYIYYANTLYSVRKCYEVSLFFKFCWNSESQSPNCLSQLLSLPRTTFTTWTPLSGARCCRSGSTLSTRRSVLRLISTYCIAEFSIFLAFNTVYNRDFRFEGKCMLACTTFSVVIFLTGLKNPVG